MEQLLEQLPATLYDGQWECTLWLTLTASTVGLWQAGYQNANGEMHDNYFVESDSPKVALLRLKAKVDRLNKLLGAYHA